MIRKRGGGNDTAGTKRRLEFLRHGKEGDEARANPGKKGVKERRITNDEKMRKNGLPTGRSWEKLIRKGGDCCGETREGQRGGEEGKK